MRILILLAATLCLSQVARSDDKVAPFAIEGTYSRTHQVRNWIGQCSGKAPNQCPRVTVTDRVVIRREGASTFHVGVDLRADDLHSCEFKGSGIWNDHALVVRSAEQSDPCILTVTFENDQIARLASSGPQDACAMHCGASAQLYVERMPKQSVPKDEKDWSNGR